MIMMTLLYHQKNTELISQKNIQIYAELNAD